MSSASVRDLGVLFDQEFAFLLIVRRAFLYQSRKLSFISFIQSFTPSFIHGIYIAILQDVQL